MGYPSYPAAWPRHCTRDGSSIWSPKRSVSTSSTTSCATKWTGGPPAATVTPFEPATTRRWTVVPGDRYPARGGSVHQTAPPRTTLPFSGGMPRSRPTSGIGASRAPTPTFASGPGPDCAEAWVAGWCEVAAPDRRGQRGFAAACSEVWQFRCPRTTSFASRRPGGVLVPPTLPSTYRHVDLDAGGGRRPPLTRRPDPTTSVHRAGVTGPAAIMALRPCHRDKHPGHRGA